MTQTGILAAIFGDAFAALDEVLQRSCKPCAKTELINRAQGQFAAAGAGVAGALTAGAL